MFYRFDKPMLKVDDKLTWSYLKTNAKSGIACVGKKANKENICSQHHVISNELLIIKFGAYIYIYTCNIQCEKM